MADNYAPKHKYKSTFRLWKVVNLNQLTIDLLLGAY
jgi:hypothetical protein